MDLSLDGESVRSLHSCEACGREYVMVRSFVLDSGTPVAIAFAACHRHGGESEIWIDAAMGSFSEPAFADQATFSCVVRSEGSVSLMPGPVAAEGRAEFFGSMLTPDGARSDPRLEDFWEIVDFIVAADPTVAEAVNGPHPPRPESRANRLTTPGSAGRVSVPSCGAPPRDSR